MFEDSTFESTGRIRTRSQRWMIAALALNGSILIALIVIPLIYPEALPHPGPMILMEAPKPPAAAPAPMKKPEQAFHGTSEMSGPTIFAPRQIPTTITRPDGPDDAPPSTDLAEFESGNSIPGGVTGVFNSRTATPIGTAPKGPMPVSTGVMTGQLIYNVKPLYPRMGEAMHAEGTVVLQAIISKTGTIENLRVVSGPPILQQAALDAVKQWRYRPYELNGQPVEVETTINVVFILGR